MNAVDGIIQGFRARSGDLTFLDRLDDLRSRLIWSGLALLLGTGIGFYLAISFDVLGIVTAPILPFLGGEKLKYLSPLDPFFITLKLAVCMGIVLALPIVLIQLWRLLAPLMRPEEKRYLAPSIIAAVLLFSVGAVFCYYLVLPTMLRFTMGFQPESLEQSIVIGDYLKIVLRMLLAFGLAFELPIAILLGTLLGIVTPDFLVQKRRHAIALIVITSGILTPPDVSSLVLLALPVWILYEISIVVTRLVVARGASPIPLPEH